MKAVPQEILDNMHVTADDFEAALNEVEPSAMREVLIEVSEVSWNDVGGLNEARQEIIEAVEWPLKNPEKFLKMGSSLLRESCFTALRVRARPFWPKL